MKHFAILFGALCALACPAAQFEPLSGARRVLFLGDSITYSGQYVELIEAHFAARSPERHIEFLNLGLPSETVSGLSEEGHAGGKFPRPDLHERLARVLERTKPDVVIACYGMNDGIYLPFDSGRFARFTNGIARLRERVMAANARIVHVTPPVFDEVKGKAPGYADTLARYAAWLLAKRAAGWDVVDLHGPMKDFLAKRRESNPNFFLAGDGIHPNETGHWFIARQILLHLGAEDLDRLESASAMLSSHPDGARMLKLIQQKQRVLKDAWLTATGHQRPGMSAGMPLPEAQARANDLTMELHRLARKAK